MSDSYFLLGDTPNGFKFHNKEFTDYQEAEEESIKLARNPGCPIIIVKAVAKAELSEPPVRVTRAEESTPEFLPYPNQLIQVKTLTMSHYVERYATGRMSDSGMIETYVNGEKNDGIILPATGKWSHWKIGGKEFTLYGKEK